MNRMFVVSPHLDDAVLGIGLRMREDPGVCVTLLAGSPWVYPRLQDRPHDEICGLGGHPNPMAVRRAEDEAAMDVLGWEAVHVGLLDAQYVWPARRADEDTEIALATLEQIWRAQGQPGEVWTVAGLGHEDHQWTAGVARQFAAAHDVTLRVWFEPGYRSKFVFERDDVAQGCSGKVVHYLISPVEAVAKLRLVERYESQLSGISGLALRDALVAEVSAVAAVSRARDKSVR